VSCSHMLLLGAEALTKLRLGLTRADRGYICMPLFHSNAWYLGVMPLLAAGGSFVVRRRFSASGFEQDLLDYGVTYMNYVGQPIHYILQALEAKYGSGDEVTAALAKDPRNKFRIAHGNGAPAIDRKKLVRYFGMEHVYELYGSTEATISTLVKPGDPLDSVGAAKKSIVILGEGDRVCEPGLPDPNGQLTNYDAAVGEICRKITTDNIFFQGYYKREGATNNKYRGGYYRSGDLGHIRIVRGKRYLYFNGRTDDWIRKDGENFSAKSVTEHVLEHPDVELAAVYGVPAPVADELVVAAVQLREGAQLDPELWLAWFQGRAKNEGMDEKWVPDFVRVVDRFTMTETQKILIRPLKREGIDVVTHPDLQIYFRRRGDTTYRPLDARSFPELAAEYEETQRRQLIRAR
ncbi:MAG: AMP-binding protein, partial [Planctomycetota bacterium]